MITTAKVEVPVQTIYIVTPSFKSAGYIDRAILSVVSQAGKFNIRYHVQDGNSGDGTVDRLRWWETQLKTGTFPLQCCSVELTYASEVDSGMYDGLAKGFAALSPPDDAFVTWINSDDILMPGACATLANLADTFAPDDVAWVSGKRRSTTEDGVPRTFDYVPQPTLAVRYGVCDGTLMNYVQQEGTAFRGWLLPTITEDPNFRAFRLAGDWYLWVQLAQKAELHHLTVSLGSFSRREGQLSRAAFDYMDEIESVISTRARQDGLISLIETQGLSFARLDWNHQDWRYDKVSVPIDKRTMTGFAYARARGSELADRIEQALNEHVPLSSSQSVPTPKPAPQLAPQLALTKEEEDRVTAERLDYLEAKARKRLRKLNKWRSVFGLRQRKLPWD